MLNTYCLWESEQVALWCFCIRLNRFYTLSAILFDDSKRLKKDQRYFWGANFKWENSHVWKLKFLVVAPQFQAKLSSDSVYSRGKGSGLVIYIWFMCKFFCWNGITEPDDVSMWACDDSGIMLSLRRRKLPNVQCIMGFHEADIQCVCVMRGDSLCLPPVDCGRGRRSNTSGSNRSSSSQEQYGRHLC